MRYELTGGGSSKFWEIVLDGKKLRVTWGRIGTDGRTQTKGFNTPELGRAARDRLIAEKLKKGYGSRGKNSGSGTSKATNPAKATSLPRKGGAARIERTATQIEAYSELLENVEGLDVLPRVLKRSSPASIATIEKRLGVTLPADVKAFLLRGLKSVDGSLGEPFASIGFDFLDANGIVQNTEMLRKVAADADDEHQDLIRTGIALTYSEPELVLGSRGVYLFSFRNPLLVIATTFSEFLEHYLGAGCFSSHAFPALWKVVASYVPEPIPLNKNVWLSAYKKQFPAFFQRRPL